MCSVARSHVPIHRNPRKKGTWCLLLRSLTLFGQPGIADTRNTSIFGLGVSPEVVNTRSHLMWICFQGFMLASYVVSL